MLSGIIGSAQSALGYCGWYNSPLLTAAQNGNAAEVTRLLALGANPNYKTYINQEFPLFVAAKAGHLPVVELLLDAGADINLKKYSETALVAAAHANRINVVTHLIQYPNVEYDTDVSDCDSPIGHAISSDHNEMVTLLLDFSRTPISAAYLFECLTLAAQSNALETFKNLMTRASALGATIDTQSLFEQAARNGANGIINELLTTEHRPTNSMPFIEAATHCHNAIAKRLLDCMPTPAAKWAAIESAITAINLMVNQQNRQSEQRNAEFSQSIAASRASISQASQRANIQLGLDTAIVLGDGFLRRHQRDRLPLSLGFPAAATSYHFRHNVADIERQQRQLDLQISNHRYDMNRTSGFIGQLASTLAFLTTELANLNQAVVLEHASSSTSYAPRYAETTSSSSSSTPASSITRDSRKRTVREDSSSDSDADVNTFKASRFG